MSLIGRFEHLPKRPRSDEARPLLEKIASQVKPIMSKRSWKVGTLAEFLPSNPALLGNNMNHGQRINLRLRPPDNPSTFYEYDQLVLVMLHELTHIEHGPHNAQFYKLLAELEEEYYELKRKGYSGEGFHGQGNHLSGFKVPEHVGKAKGLHAAQKRLDTQKIIGRGGVLGGSAYKGRDMRAVLAEAAERRIRDDKSCQTAHEGHTKEVEEEVRRAQEESVGIDAIDLEGSRFSQTSRTSEKNRIVQENDPVNNVKSSASNKVISGRPRAANSTIKQNEMEGRTSPAGSIGIEDDSDDDIVEVVSAQLAKPSESLLAPAKEVTKKSPAAGSVTRLTRPQTTTLSTHPSPDRAPQSDDNRLNRLSDEWSCPTCTLINQPHCLSCEACTTTRPSLNRMIDGPGGGWMCGFCGAGPRDKVYWTCGVCGWVRNFG